jgi:hypothetical protein
LVHRPLARDVLGQQQSLAANVSQQWACFAMTAFKLSQADHWPVPPARYQAVAIAIFLLIIAAMPLFSR